MTCRKPWSHLNPWTESRCDSPFFTEFETFSICTLSPPFRIEFLPGVVKEGVARALI